ncbi:TPM domain-containing protein [Bacillaceae bacterium IKA-2]|nr:TPM domain-containing protein [Bacillaceae bacterium IKA-2]
MKSKLLKKTFSIMILFIFIIQSGYPVMAQINQKIYDYAELLTTEELKELESLSNQYSENRQVDIIILTTKDTAGLEVESYMQDFYDEMGLGYDKSHGNTVILTIDMEQREVYVAGFYKGEEYIDNNRADLIREKITSDLSGGYYFDAFRSYIELSNEYLGISPEVNSGPEPGVNPGESSGISSGVSPGLSSEKTPDNILLKLWFQILVSILIAGVIVFIMIYRSGGRVTTSAGTYLDASNSKVTKRRDTYVRTTITKVKKPSNKNNSSGGGGGMTMGGHSHSGSKGKF